MMRRNSSSRPWSRPLLTGLALTGAALTGYLTLVELTEINAACPTEGCETVLNSAYGEIAGLPLPLFGLGAYLLVALLALVLQRLSEETDQQWQERAWIALFWLTTAMAVFSGYLMFVLATDLQVLCVYCLASAVLSLGLWLTTLLGKRWEDWGKLGFDGVVIALVVSFAAIAINGTSSLASTGSLANNSQSNLALGNGYQGAAIATTATLDNIALAKHLKDSGAKMYGAYWCSHCHDQKSLFGAEALAELPYVECDPKGNNAQPKQCKAAKVDGYPTWIINGQTLSGTQELADLADASDYLGSRKFSNAS